ncbi:bacteriorhodopsin [Gloeocapsopsis dulcis]|uniref:Lactococcin n=1 Tax=Gloeocapsopsis dulcis AAB1 = 1H9 TaxID=1433147 RepID=A0A6N8G1P5_9CHRO|nr:bacteriorhodopsin [Gloeocapsopsis dulcis]MUL39253.1 lactococcin [Gloeocapsopsis dulcis AAB1 = 1H9]WNN90861.1 bacteriorhodopsin [Gloeocapsopsis dulcis]
MDLQDLFHLLYILGMAVGAIYFIWLSRNPRGVPRYEYLVAAFIPIWSGLAYLSMVLPHGELEQGKVEVAGQITHFARYIDWVVTTPLLLLALSWTGMHRLPKKDWPLIVALMITQVIVVVCGLVADLSVIPWVRYLWYFNGVVAFLVVLWGIWGPLRAKTRSQGGELSSFYDRLTTYFTVLWICYPIVWILGPSGFRVFDQTVDTFLFCLIPFFSKVGFSFLDLHGLRSISGGVAASGTDSAIGNIMQFFLRTPRRNRLSMRRRSY